jgi:hypothetical protein
MKKKAVVLYVLMSIMALALLIYAIASKEYLLLPTGAAILSSSILFIKSKAGDSSKQTNPIPISILLPASATLVALFLLVCKLFVGSLNVLWYDILIIAMVAISVIFEWYTVLKKYDFK